MSEIDKLHQVIKTLSKTVSSISKENIELNLKVVLLEEKVSSLYDKLYEEGVFDLNGT